MVPLSCFDKIVYKKPSQYRFDKPLQKIIGFDSEAYRSGLTFLYATSEGDIIAPPDLFSVLVSDKYLSSNFVTWNLKYESGAILRVFPHKVLHALQQFHEAEYVFRDEKYLLSYIPHKQLRIKQDKWHGKSVRFWDMSPFYGRVKLETAAKEYLHESKHDVNPELFTEEYVKAHFDEIAKYCVQDCVLTKRLADLWISKFEQTGISVTSLYSEASISFTYISRKTDIVTPYEYWDYNKKLIRYAFESYEGGKFEVLARGKFSGYEYDISSAYPKEIANLIDIRNARIVYSNAYVPEAVYGFLRVRISLKNPDVRLPCGVLHKIRTYPMGSYFITITKQEYDYITKELSVPVEIIDAAWIIVSCIRYPYDNIINELYIQKSFWKKKDRLRSNNYKIIMNGFYGKMAQCIEDVEGNYVAGQGWNPIYASIITANTRIAVTRLQNLLGRDALAVHTDSVITRVRIPDRFIGKNMGEFELVEEGDGVIVACGIYQINDQSALKGIIRDKDDKLTHKKSRTIIDILKGHPGQSEIELRIRHVESWLQSMSMNHPVSAINVFSDEPKKLDLNCDTKRIWPGDVTSDDLLNSLQFSEPLIERQFSEPKFWTEKNS